MTRSRLQLHLSTLLIVSLLAAGLVWLNVRSRPDAHSGKVVVATMDDPRHLFTGAVTLSRPFDGRGWPMTFQVWYEDVFNQRHEWTWQAFILNIVVCLALLAIATAAIEWATRWAKRADGFAGGRREP